MYNNKVIKILLISIILVLFNINKASSSQLNDLSIVVTSCDKYSAL